MKECSIVYEDFVPKRISTLRVAKGVSARKMSSRLGQNENYINLIENKKSLPSMEVFFYICQYFDISPADFFGNTRETTPDQQRAIDLIYRIKDRDLEMLIPMMERVASEKP